MREGYDTAPVSVVPHWSSTIDREAADLKSWNRVGSVDQHLGGGRERDRSDAQPETRYGTAGERLVRKYVCLS
jgi:hypothetical protein